MIASRGHMCFVITLLWYSIVFRPMFQALKSWINLRNEWILINYISFSRHTEVLTKDAAKIKANIRMVLEVSDWKYGIPARTIVFTTCKLLWWYYEHGTILHNVGNISQLNVMANTFFNDANVFLTNRD